MKNTRWRYISLVVLSLVYSLSHAGPLNGTFSALLLAICTQLYLPGFLAARAAGKIHGSHPITALAWIFGSGLAIVLPLAAALRLVNAPLTLYILVLHGLMLILAVLPPATPVEPAWKFQRKHLALYAALIVAYLMAEILAYAQAQYRRPGDAATQGIAQIAERVNTTRSSADLRFTSGMGLSDVQAGWSLVSGVSGAEIVWHAMGPLFAGWVPILFFALGYELTRRDSAAVLTALCALIFGMLTLDNLTFWPTASGQFAFFDLTTPARFSAAIVLPLTLWLTFVALRHITNRIEWLFVGLLLVGLSLLHLREVGLYALAIAPTLLLHSLAVGRLGVLRKTILALAVPGAIAVAVAISGGRIGAIPAAAPEPLFYHPLIGVAVVLALGWIVFWRRSLLAQFIVGATAAALILAYVPGRLVGYAGQGLPLVIPVALILACTLDGMLSLLQHVKRLQGTPLAQWAALALVILAVLLVLDPGPLPINTRAQFNALNDRQSAAQVQAYQQTVVATLKAYLPSESLSVVIMPPSIEPLALEELPDVRLVSWSDAPFWDNADSQRFEREGVDVAVVDATNGRLPQMLMRPDRFKLLGTAAGSMIFAVPTHLSDGDTQTDGLFARMNQALGNLTTPPLIEAWLALGTPGDEGRYGLAWSYLLAGKDDAALPIFRDLHTRYPDAAPITDALVSILERHDDKSDAVQLLLDVLGRGGDAARVLAIRTLLTEPLSRELNDVQLDNMLVVLDAERETRAQLSDVETLRRQALILMGRNRWAAAAATLDLIPLMERTAADYANRALALLAQGSVNEALTSLEPATNREWLAPRRAAGGWISNSAAQLYYLLKGAQAKQARDYSGAAGFYQQAVDAGSTWAGRYFLAEVYRVMGQGDRADSLYGTLEAEWLTERGTPLPEMESLLSAAQYGALYAADPVVRRGDDERALSVSAAFAQPFAALYPVTKWRYYMVDLEKRLPYFSQDIPANFVEGAFVHFTTPLTLPADSEPLKQTRLIIEPQYSNALTFGTASIDVVLNRPAPAPSDPAMVPLAINFGADIMLQGYTWRVEGNQLAVTLFWEASAEPEADYQIFVHVLDADNRTAAQADSGPLVGQYPTSQWRIATRIADKHIIPLDSLQKNAKYTVQIGMYHLPDLERVPLSISDNVLDNTVTLFTFER